MGGSRIRSCPANPKGDVAWKTGAKSSVGPGKLRFRGCDRMFGAHDHVMISPLFVPQRVLQTALQESCQMRKSFHNNAITLMALCLMSDILEDPTTNAAVTA
ncbi:hypothetical protein NKH24_35640 [Mesorhizobium sp. M1300]|uniref:hypothetical protein n=1 Tax=Mesorhizobium sp. M1300 TaxID=2957077 RepID=UPI00333D86CE